jgi:hypothetical protein
MARLTDRGEAGRLAYGRGAAVEATPGWSLALIGNASGTVLGRRGISIRGVFDEETRRKALVFAADAVSYVI